MNLLLSSEGKIMHFYRTLGRFLGFPGGSEGEESSYNAGDLGSIPGSGRPPGEGHGTHSSILVWKISWTEGPGGLQSMELQIVGYN